MFGNGNLSPETSQNLTAYYMMLVDIERISDYSIHIDRQAVVISKEKSTDEEIKILKKMKSRTFKMHDLIFDLKRAGEYNDHIDENTQEWRNMQIQGLKNKTISSELGISFSRILTDYDRINDHALNLAEEIDKIDNELFQPMISD